MNEGLKSGKTSTPRTRSYGGCGMCRIRHIKCDETKPICLRCISDNVKCDGYTRRIFFDAKEDDGKSRFRQTLFSDEERKQMNLSMTEEVPFRKALTVLTDIDYLCEKALENSEEQVDIFRGPFGAFKLSISELQNRRPSTPGVLITYSRTQSPRIDLSDPETFQIPDWLDTSSIFDFENTNTMPSPFTQAFNPPISSSLPPLAHFRDYSMDDALPSPMSAINFFENTSLLQDAPILLQDYANNFIPSLTPFRHTKTPWHILFLPNVKNTLASIAIGQDLTAADLTTFFGVLSISALNLHSQSLKSKWQIQAGMFKRYAEEQIQIVLRHALDKPKVFKYKSILMALLTMIQISMLEGLWSQTDLYLLEAEKIIRLKGLTRPRKSRKVRILHHCYAYIRIFHESLSLNSIQSQMRHQLMLTVQGSGTIPRGSDAPTFRLSPWGDDLDTRFQEMKSPEAGENDLHLGSPGLWPSTLYPEIFGVPETWLNLLSQVIRLGNEKELSNNEDRSNLPLKDFTLKAKALERYILRWDGAFKHNVEPMQIIDVDWILLQNMQNALRHGLTIYFYRRIHDIDQELLQPKVEKVKDCLFACKSLCKSGESINALMWPAFIAGCEASDGKLQTEFSEWFDYSTRNNKQSSFARMHQLMRHVWDLKTRDEKGQTNWLHLLKENSLHL